MTYALVLTILIEYVVLRCLGETRRRVLLTSVASNILTNIPLNLYLLSTPVGMGAILFLETLVVVLEALAYWLVTRDARRSLVYSLLCNIISFLTGLLIELLLTYLQII